MSTIINPNLTSLNDFVVEAQKNPKPIIVWDTCSLLDIVRRPARENSTFKDYDRHIKPILTAIDAADIYSVCSEASIYEWNEYIDFVTKDAKKQINDRVKFLSNAMEYPKHLFSLPATQTAINNPEHSNIISIFSGIALTLISKSTFITANGEINSAAATRVFKKQLPAANKEEFKDAVVLETYLHLFDALHPYNLAMTLFSSNTTDFSADAINLMVSDFKAIGKNISVETVPYKMFKSFYP